MQIFRTSRAQNLGPRSEELPATSTADPELQDAVNDFFNQDPLSEDPSLPPSNPFDILVMGTPSAPGTEGAGPSTSQFAPARVITMEQWLMANPEGRYYLPLYKEKMEAILQTRFIDRRDRLQQNLNNGGMSPIQARVVQQVLQEINAGIVKMQQEIEKAEARIAEQNQVYLREGIEMRDLNNDRYIGDPTSENYYILAKYDDGTDVILEKDGKTVAANPFLDPNYQPALIDTDSVALIDRDRLNERPPGANFFGFDEALEIKPWNPDGFPENTFGAQIDVTAAEGFWVEADPEKPGEPLKDKEPGTNVWHYKPKPLEVVRRDEDNNDMFGQIPPAEDERNRWVFVKATDLEIFSEKVLRNGEEIDGGYVHYVFKDAKGIPIMRLRFDGVETRSANPLVTDGTNYTAATSVGIAVNAGKIIQNGEEVFTQHSSRISYINVDAGGFESTGKVFPTRSFEEFKEELGLPSDFSGRLQRLSDEKPMDSSGEVELASERERAVQAADETLYAPYFGRGWEGTERGNRLQGDFMAAYIPDDDEWKDAKSGVAIVGLRGNIVGTKFNDIVIVPPPDEEARKKMLPFAAEEIDPHNPAYATTVDVSGPGYGTDRNIVIVKGGDAYVRGATFFYSESSPGRRGDQIYLDVSDVNKSAEGKNHRIFVQIENANPDVVAVVNGTDLDEDEIEEMKSDGDKKADPREVLDAANDDYFKVPSGTDFSDDAHELPDGMGSVGEDSGGLKEQFTTAFNDARGKLDSDIIHKDPLSEEFFGEGFGGWDLPASVKIEDAQYDAFFEEWEFFSDQEPDMNLEGMQNE